MGFIEAVKHPRALSIFKNGTKRWEPILVKPFSGCHPEPAYVVEPQSLTLTSWNLQASMSSTTVVRSKLILDHILKAPKVSDMIFFQEVTPGIRQALLDDERVRARYLTTDAEDDASFRNVPFTTMTLLSNERFGPSRPYGPREKLAVDDVFRVTLPSRFRRDALCVDITHPAIPPETLRFINVHLDSLSFHFRRLLEMQILASLLQRADTTMGGMIAGDFNAIYPEDHKLIEANQLLDVWTLLRGDADGATWMGGFKFDEDEMKKKRKGGRLDKVVISNPAQSRTIPPHAIEPHAIEVIPPGLIGDGRPWPWSDHCGLRCTFNI